MDGGGVDGGRGPGGLAWNGTSALRPWGMRTTDKQTEAPPSGAAAAAPSSGDAGVPHAGPSWAAPWPPVRRARSNSKLRRVFFC
eukprot:5033513-Pyramimonas_sp.AAC.1